LFFYVNPCFSIQEFVAKGIENSKNDSILKRVFSSLSAGHTWYLLLKDSSKIVPFCLLAQLLFLCKRFDSFQRKKWNKRGHIIRRRRYSFWDS